MDPDIKRDARSKARGVDSLGLVCQVAGTGQHFGGVEAEVPSEEHEVGQHHHGRMVHTLSVLPLPVLPGGSHCFCPVIRLCYLVYAANAPLCSMCLRSSYLHYVLPACAAPWCLVVLEFSESAGGSLMEPSQVDSTVVWTEWHSSRQPTHAACMMRCVQERLLRTFTGHVAIVTHPRVANLLTGFIRIGSGLQKIPCVVGYYHAASD